jgi:hypothetical protein
MSVVLLLREAGYVTPQRIRVRDRVAARVRAGRLDAALARGVAPESSAALELRAQALIGPVARKLGELLREIVASAHASDRPARAPVPISASLVREAEFELSALAERLLGGGPVGARGVARLRELVCDGGGPLYGRFHDAAALRAALGAALEALEVDG